MEAPERPFDGKPYAYWVRGMEDEWGDYGSLHEASEAVKRLADSYKVSEDRFEIICKPLA